MKPHLKLFRGDIDQPEDHLNDGDDEANNEPLVRSRLRDLLPLIAMAHNKNLLWLNDFLDDEIMISEDLHEIIVAFQYNKPA